MAVKSERITARIDPELKSFLERYGADISAQLREDLIVLQELVRRTEADLAGRFTVGEASLLCDVLNGYHFTPEHIGSQAQGLALEVSDGCRLNALDEKWGVFAEGLVDKLKDLTSLEAYILVHWARIFWTKPEAGKDDIKKIFRCN